MTKEEIKKLNDYFNNIFIELEKNDFEYITKVIRKWDKEVIK